MGEYSPQPGINVRRCLRLWLRDAVALAVPLNAPFERQFELWNRRIQGLLGRPPEPARRQPKRILDILVGR